MSLRPSSHPSTVHPQPTARTIFVTSVCGLQYPVWLDSLRGKTSGNCLRLNLTTWSKLLRRSRSSTQTILTLSSVSLASMASRSEGQAMETRHGGEVTAIMAMSFSRHSTELMSRGTKQGDSNRSKLTSHLRYSNGHRELLYIYKRAYGYCGAAQ